MRPSMTGCPSSDDVATNRSFNSLTRRPAMIFLPAPGSSASRKRKPRLGSRPKRACVLNGHRFREVTGQRDLEADEVPERGSDRRFHAEE